MGTSCIGDVLYFTENQPDAFTHTLLCVVLLRTGRSSKMTPHATHPERKSAKTTKMLFSHFVLLTVNNQITNFPLFVGL